MSDNLAAALTDARRRKGWSLTQAAARLGISKAHLHDMEHAKACNPTLCTIAAFVREYKLTPQFIISMAEKR